MRTKVFCIFLLICTTSSFAVDRNAKVRELMETQGLLKMFQAQMEAGKVQTDRQAKQVMDQLLAGLNPTNEYRARFQGAFDALIAALSTPWTAEDIVSEWAKAYAKDFSDKELDQLLVYYKSALGKKEVAAVEKAMPVMNTYFAEQSRPVIERATRKYIDDLQLIAKDCNCRK